MNTNNSENNEGLSREILILSGIAMLAMALTHVLQDTNIEAEENAIDNRRDETQALVDKFLKAIQGAQKSGEPSVRTHGGLVLFDYDGVTAGVTETRCVLFDPNTVDFSSKAFKGNQEIIAHAREELALSWTAEGLNLWKGGLLVENPQALGEMKQACDFIVHEANRAFDAQNNQGFSPAPALKDSDRSRVLHPNVQ